MAGERLRFADASADPDGSEAALFGVPFDGTASFRPGARFGPNAIRQASYNFETYHLDRAVDLAEGAFCDLGDLGEVGDASALDEAVEAFVAERVGADQFPLALGGEHSLTPGCVRPHGRPSFVVLDAHMDFREAYLDDPHSHACVSRRVAERVGPDRVLMVGVRSASREEAADGEALGVRVIHADAIHEAGLDPVQEALDVLPDPVYLSLDMDAVDPAYAPAVGNPEPFGLTPHHVRAVIRDLAPRLVGFDVTEVSPPWDGGETAALAARLVREVLAGLLAADRL